MNISDLKDLFQKYMHDSKNVKIKTEEINEVTEYGIFKFKYTINLSTGDDNYTLVYKCTNNENKFDRKGRFNNNLYENKFFKNNTEIENSFDTIIKYIKEVMTTMNIEDVVEDKNIIQEHFIILKEGVYIYNLTDDRKYQITLNKDLLIILNKNNFLDIYLPDYFKHNRVEYFCGDILKIENILYSIYETIRQINNEKRRKFKDFIPFYDEWFNISEQEFINTNIKNILRDIKVKKVKQIQQEKKIINFKEI